MQFYLKIVHKKVKNYCLIWVSVWDELPAMSTSCSIILCNLVESGCLVRLRSILPLLKFDRNFCLSEVSRLSWAVKNLFNMVVLQNVFLSDNGFFVFNRKLTIITPFTLANGFFNESICPPIGVLSSSKTFRHSQLEIRYP